MIQKRKALGLGEGTALVQIAPATSAREAREILAGMREQVEELVAWKKKGG